MSEISYPNDEIKSSAYGFVLMLSSMYFDELDSVRKKIQGELMGKVDCVWEACQESYNNGVSKGIEDVARSMLMDDFPVDVVSKHTGLSLDAINDLKSDMV